MTPDPFQYVKENTDIIEVAQTYGLEVNNQNKALCLFHPDNNPSMSFKGNYYHCFSCGAHGSVIDLVMELCELDKPIEAVKQINADFNLGLDLDGDYKPDLELMQQREKEKATLKRFEAWVEQTHAEYCRLSRYYWANIQKYKPNPLIEWFHPLYVEAINQWDRINYILDILSRGSPEEQIQLYKHLKEVKASP